MTDKTSTDQYGRKQWDVDLYEAEAKHGRDHIQQPDEALSRRLKNQNFLEHRADLLGQSIDAIGKHTLIGSGKATTSTYGKNKRFGFSCPTCDLSFRDTLALVDHFNSPQHLNNVRNIAGTDLGTGEEFEAGVKRASTTQVIDAIEELVKKSLRQKAAANQGEVLSLQERVKRRLAFEQKKTQRRHEKRRKRVAKLETQETEMGKLMGFEGFGSTKIG